MRQMVDNAKETGDNETVKRMSGNTAKVYSMVLSHFIFGEYFGFLQHNQKLKPERCFLTSEVKMLFFSMFVHVQERGLNSYCS